MSLYESVHSVLADRKGEVLFKCFGIWHILFIVLFAIIFIKAFLYTRNKSIETKLKITQEEYDKPEGGYMQEIEELRQELEQLNELLDRIGE